MLALLLILPLFPCSQSSPWAGNVPPEPWVVVGRVEPVSLDTLLNPQLAVLPSGALVVCVEQTAHCGTDAHPALHVYRSIDEGGQWSKIAALDGPCSATLFVADNALYLMGSASCGRMLRGAVAIRRSEDEGRTWTTAEDQYSGLVSADVFHGNWPTLLVHSGRIWAPFETHRSQLVGSEPTIRSELTICSAAVGADLLRADSWRWSRSVPIDDRELIVGNHDVFALRSGAPQFLTSSLRGTALLRAECSADGSVLHAAEPATAWRVASRPASRRILHDAKRDLFFMVTRPSAVDEAQEDVEKRSTMLALASSRDCDTWNTHSILMRGDPDAGSPFGWTDWTLAEDDLIAVTLGGTGTDGSQQWRNGIHFLRVRGFRERTLADPPLWTGVAAK